MTLAKIVNGQIEWFKNPPFILGDATSYALSNGYKPIQYGVGNGGIYETDINIIIETPIPDEWLYAERTIRITAPLILLFTNQIWAAFSIYADKMNIPYERINNTECRYYLQEILPEHASLFNSLNINIEYKSEPLE